MKGKEKKPTEQGREDSGNMKVDTERVKKMLAGRGDRRKEKNKKGET